MFEGDDKEQVWTAGKAEKQPPWIVTCRVLQQAGALMLGPKRKAVWAVPAPGPPQLAGRGPSCAHAPAAQALRQAQRMRASSHAAMTAMPAHSTCIASGRAPPGHVYLISPNPTLQLLSTQQPVTTGTTCSAASAASAPPPGPGSPCGDPLRTFAWGPWPAHQPQSRLVPGHSRLSNQPPHIFAAPQGGLGGRPHAQRALEQLPQRHGTRCCAATAPLPPRVRPRKMPL